MDKVVNTFDRFHKKLSKLRGSVSLSVYELGSRTPDLLSHFTSYEPVFLHFDGDTLLEGIYQHKSTFYIYLKKDGVHFYNLKIIFEPKQLNEVKFYIDRLNKLKNG